MSSSGVMAVAVGPDGRVRAANAAFALRATGTGLETHYGQLFADFVRMDEKGSVFFEREGRRGLPIRLLHVPLNQNAAEGAALLLAVDEEGAKVDRGLALAHVEQLLSTCRWGSLSLTATGAFCSPMMPSPAFWMSNQPNCRLIRRPGHQRRQRAPSWTAFAVMAAVP